MSKFPLKTHFHLRIFSRICKAVAIRNFEIYVIDILVYSGKTKDGVLLELFHTKNTWQIMAVDRRIGYSSEKLQGVSHRRRQITELRIQ